MYCAVTGEEELPEIDTGAVDIDRIESTLDPVHDEAVKHKFDAFTLNHLYHHQQ